MSVERRASTLTKVPVEWRCRQIWQYFPASETGPWLSPPPTCVSHVIKSLATQHSALPRLITHRAALILYGRSI